MKSTFDFNFRSPLPVIASGLFTGAKDYQPGLRRETRYFALHVQTGSAHSELSLCCCKWVRRSSFILILHHCRADIDSDIATAAIGPRSVVATGADELEACQWEVEADTERFIQTAEVCLFHLPCLSSAKTNETRKLSVHTHGLHTISWSSLRASLVRLSHTIRGLALTA